MPVVNGRLTCCTCGADLGDAEDPYRDPSCIACINREAAEETAADEARDAKGRPEDDIETMPTLDDLVDRYSEPYP
jgi:hypothetical protein